MSKMHISKVSIIIPVYNVEDYIFEALNSVYNQTYRNLEIIIIDDGSTDRSGRLCDEYAERDSRAHVIHQNNRGLSNARNAGLDLMTGDAVAFLDSDDALCPKYISLMVDEMNRTDADIVVCRYTVHKTIGSLNSSRIYETNPAIKAGVYDRNAALRHLTDGALNVTVWNKLYSSDLWRDIRFPDGHVYEDSKPSYRVFSVCNTVSVLDSSLYRYRKRPGSITKTCTGRNIRDQLLAQRRTTEFIRDNVPELFTEKQLRRYRERQLNSLMYLYAISIKAEKVERKGLRDDIRGQILSTGQETSLANCGLRTRVAYQMICKCPWLLRIIYPVYLHVRLLTRKLVSLK